MFHVGELLLGVRSSSAEIDELLRRVLAPHHVPRAEAPPNYSVRIEETPEVGGRDPVHTLYWAHSPLLRAHRPRRLLEGLLAHLGSWGESPRDDLVQVRALALVGAKGAVLAPSSLRYDFVRLERRLQRAGLHRVDAPVVGLDAATGEVVVPPPALALEQAVADEVDRRWPAGRRQDPPAVPPGRYRLLGWVLEPFGVEAGHPLRRSVAAAEAFGLVLNVPSLGPARALHDVARLIAGCSGLVALPGKPHETAGALIALSAAA